MWTAPGIMPASYSSCSRTSRNVALLSPSRVSASEVGISVIRALGLGEQLAEAGHQCSWKNGSCGVKCYRTGRIFPTPVT